MYVLARAQSLERAAARCARHAAAPRRSRHHDGRGQQRGVRAGAAAAAMAGCGARLRGAAARRRRAVRRWPPAGRLRPLHTRSRPATAAAARAASRRDAAPPGRDAGMLAPAPGARLIEDALRVPSLAMTPVALAHDRASGRFVFGDATGRKLVIVDERMHFVVDLVREASAGFYDITAFEIDARRGDLWVVSAERPPAPRRCTTCRWCRGGRSPASSMPDGADARPIRRCGRHARRCRLRARWGRSAPALDAAGRDVPSPWRHGWTCRAPPALRRPVTDWCTSRTSGGVSRVDIAVRPRRRRAGWREARCRPSRGCGGTPARCWVSSGSGMGPAASCGCESTRRPAAHVSPQVLASGIAIPAPSAITRQRRRCLFRQPGGTGGHHGRNHRQTHPARAP